ncbi:unnamed protein product [Bursaphelenchus okinawaensis]|uniref:Uncharacterized protein n=1 Tax=Bursaphelenchus okinawaensis TaxID=465554 RepID=A0A811L9Q1_9BILA|nr:unnamed protein product [Bursaphelenchus okinawaensis]CAG9119372.1 unnamed protein product [Bursaphelenchus okinawaensis]
MGDTSARCDELFSSDGTVDDLPFFSSSEPESSKSQAEKALEELLSDDSSFVLSESEEEDGRSDHKMSAAENIDVLAEHLKSMLGMSENNEFREKAMQLMDGAKTLDQFKNNVKKKMTEFMQKSENFNKNKDVLANLKKKGVRTKRGGASKTIQKPKGNNNVHLNPIDLINALRSPLRSQQKENERAFLDLLSSSQNSDQKIDGMITETDEELDNWLDTSLDNVGELSSMSSLTLVPSLSTSLPLLSETDDEQLDSSLNLSQNLL